jgi:hypothetical protein
MKSNLYPLIEVCKYAITLHQIKLSFMKVDFFIFLMLCIMLPSNAISQDNAQNESEQDIKPLLCQKWKPTKGEAQGKTFPLTSLRMKFFMIFKADDRFKKADGDGEFGGGKWRYNHKTTTLSIDDVEDGKLIYKIVKITKEELIMTTKMEGETIKIFMSRVIK